MKDVYERPRNTGSYNSYIPFQGKPFQCHICQRKFFELENLREHQRCKHDPEEVRQALRAKTAFLQEQVDRSRQNTMKGISGDATC